MWQVSNDSENKRRAIEMDREYSEKIPNCSNEESKSGWQGLRDRDPQSSRAGWGTQTRAERQKARAHRGRKQRWQNVNGWGLHPGSIWVFTTLSI